MPQDPAAGSDPGRAAPLRPDGVGPQLRSARHQRAHRPRRGRPRHPGGHPGGRRRRVRPRRTRSTLDRELVERWLGHRNDVSALAPLWRGGIVVDTAEVSGPWAALPGLFDEVIAALTSLEGTLAASAHQSHAYTDGACLYFTFGGRGPEGDADWRERYYRQAWDAVTEATSAHGAAISHHHGIGLNRSRFLPAPSARASRSCAGLKSTFDPAGILNPGKLGLPSPFGPAPGHERPGRQRPGRRRRHLGRARGHRPARRHRRPTCTTSRSCPTPPPRASSSSTPAMAEAVLDGGRSRPRRGRSGRGSRHRQPAGLEHRLGARHRQARGPGHRLAGPAHGRHLPRRSRPRASASPPTRRPPR